MQDGLEFSAIGLNSTLWAMYRGASDFYKTSRQGVRIVATKGAWWFDRHGLNATKGPKTIRDCLRRAGWLPTAGSTGVYLSIRARMPRVSRAAIDRAAKRVVTRIWHTNKGLGARVAAEADETCRFIREHIGDAKISAVDPPSRRARRIAFCRA